jgi:hypothetical protein
MDHVYPGMRITLKGQGRWLVEAVDECYVYLCRLCRDGSVETWKVIKTRRFV